MPPKTVRRPVMHAADGKLDPDIELTFAQAADLCHVRINLVAARRSDGLLPNARRMPDDGHRRWLVPIKDLAACGLLDPALLSDAEAQEQAAAAHANVVELAALRAEVDGLRAVIKAHESTIEALHAALTAHNSNQSHRAGAA